MKKRSSQSTAANINKSQMVIGLALVVLLLIGGLGLLSAQQSSSSTDHDIVVYKSPTCGCCKEWVKHLKNNGFSVEVHNQQNVAPIKRELGVPARLQSCHTAKVGDYVIEGHVPADLISKLLLEKPKIKGLAVPGMPMGSPGMEGPRKDDYDIVTFSENGRTSIYASR
ncbi:MAG: DUF411 domain-containing protein [Candidatus Sedimenticola sp. 20ELBAFRAG]